MAPSQAAGRGAAGFSGEAGGSVGMGRGPELGFLPSLSALPPAAWEQMCCLCQPWQAPLSFHKCSAKPEPGSRSNQSLVPSSPSAWPRAAAPVSLGMEAESSAHSACLAVTLPLSLPPSLPQVSLLENSMQMNIWERWGCGPGAQRAVCPQHISSAARRGALPPRGGRTRARLGCARAASLQQGAFAGPLFPATLRTPPAGLRTRGNGKPS